MGLVIDTVAEDNGRNGLRFESRDYIANAVASACAIRNNGQWGVYIEALCDGNRSRNASPIIEFCQVSVNGQGGMYLYANTRIGSGWVDRKNSSRVDPSIVGCVISENSGPGISCYAEGDLVMEGTRSIIREAYTSPEIERCLVYSNEENGIQIECHEVRGYAQPRVTHCSLHQNGSYEVSVAGEYASVDLSNSIVSTVHESYFDVRRHASVMPSYCLFDGSGALPDGQGNLQGNPQWTDPLQGDFSLALTSPALDSGYCPPEGDCTYNGQAPDMGAVEWWE